jgi:hypothetical protein
MDTYVCSILSILKSHKEKIDQIESFSFLLILFSLYYYLERIDAKDEECLIKILEGIFKLQNNILEKLICDRMKNIFFVFTAYIKQKVSNLIKNQTSFDKNEESEINSLTEEEKSILNFTNILKELSNNHIYFSHLKNMYEEKIMKIIKEKFNAVNFSIKDEDSKIPNKNKTRYISVKYQKKYSDFNKDKKNEFLEIQSKEEYHINLKLSQSQHSKFKIKLEKEEDLSDLKPLSTPIYLKDCLLGLSSEYPDRLKLSLESLPNIINTQPFDLDFSLPQLAESLLKLNNIYDIEDFDNLVEVSLIRLTVYNPLEMTQIFCKRFFEEEAGVKNKFQVLKILEKSIEEISEYYYTNLGKTPKVNKLHVFFENIISPLLANLKKSNIDSLIIFPEFDYLLAKFLNVISKLIKFSENHPFIYKALFESMDLFKAILYNKTLVLHKSIVLIDSMNFYSSVLSKFLNSIFLEIYPEFFPNFRVILNFLNDNLENTSKEELKIEMLKNLNNYLINLEKLKEIKEGDLKNQMVII